MAPPRPTISSHVGVPKVSFRKIQSTGKEYDGVDDKTAQQYGYNEVNVTFDRPEHYIRYVDPVESELLTQVEYDMDEQDEEWLKEINSERYKEQSERISAETFEIIIDRLEKEWFELMKRVPKPDQALPSEDSTCAVCDDGEGENANAIVFCDGCNLAVHQDCYGVPYIPEGQWLCRKCTVSPETRVECLLCPNEGGAFKQTSNGKWAHLLCAIWVPECVLGNPTFMEPIENTDKIPKQRWKLVCSICKVKQGACIQCNKSTCVTAFHVSCARRHKLLSPMKSHGENELQAFCERHLPVEMRVNRVIPPSPSLPPATPTSPVRSPKKASRAQIQTTTGPPLVPFMIVERIMDHIHRINFRKKLPFLLAVCKYWSLKREARRGAPLLKRLHLEPWATSTATRLQTDEDKTKYLDNLTKLRNDLKRVLQLTDLVRQREVEKQNQAQIVESLVTSCLMPFDTELRKTYEKVVGFDRSNYFMNPVSRIDIPEYYTVIDKPMHWLGIGEKIEQHEYLDSQAFVDDVYLVLNNAITYNKKDTPFYKAALRIKTNVQPILEQFQQTVREKSAQWASQGLVIQNELDDPQAPTVPPHSDITLHLESQTSNGVVGSNDLVDPILVEIPGQQPVAMNAEVPSRQQEDENILNQDEEIIPGTPNAEPSDENQISVDEQILLPAMPEFEEEHAPAPLQVGDMEPYLAILDMLQDQASIADDLPYIVTTDPLTSFFTYEKVIPKPPPLQVKQSRKSSKKKRTTSDALVPRGAPGTHPQRVVLLVRDPQTSETAPLPENMVELATPTSSRPPKRKRQDSDSWAQVVPDVNAHESFMLFETGWVLPPGTTRNRRPTFPSGSKPGGTDSRKQSKEPKRVRMSSSIRGDTQPPTMISSRQSSQVPPAEMQILLEESTTPLLTVQQEDRASETGAVPVPVVVTRSLQPHTTDSAESTAVNGNPAHLPVPNQPQKRDGSSDLSELSDAADGGKARLAAANAPASIPPESLQSGIHQEDQYEPLHYETGTLVWAKQQGFPFYPAAVHEPTDPMVPHNILGLEDVIRRKLKATGVMYPVQFYDKQRTWTWVPLDKLILLGENEAIDQKHLHPTSKSGSRSGNKSADRKALKEAYRLALDDMAVEDGEINEATSLS